MNQRQRQEWIAEKVKIKGSITSAEIAEEFGISKMTVGRDFKELEARGVIQLFHGGAMYKDSNILEYPISVKSDLFVNEKKRIGQRAAKEISDGSSVFLETGTTVLHVALELTQKIGCNYYTNSLLVMNHLSKVENLSLHSVPGKYRELSGGFLGMEAQNYMNHLSFDYCVIGAEAVDSNGRVSLHSEEDAFTKQAVMARSKKKILVFDRSKIDHDYLYGIGSIYDFDIVITDYLEIFDFLANDHESEGNILVV
ncbi:DeoR/GlpR family DNA-binding transcription regulator [Enterococcus devriesei]|uniref:DeoR/GlpR family DNA-binding transcription regulator n=1 Tax=Enterococcus devriesei TaxID=319970 RepID=UPI0028A7B699|nr:DeoR/GlpR family DNA-binding transcription regulator [Enterococcus devriesei]